MPSTLISGNAATADSDFELQLTGHQVLALYHALRLQTKGIRACDPSAVTTLNRRSGKRFTAKRWLQIIAPHYEQIATGFKSEPTVVTHFTAQAS